jgi:hypothetical protein
VLAGIDATQRSALRAGWLDLQSRRKKRGTPARPT